ncbi:MAG: alpha/beta hydrolase fold domain-containing protein [Burkholderiales bacterium]|nr:alpha/beta hydrolase fold domain-containing protein [Burkholderiales bacterium]MDE1925733.1 alpha/beta hydrolase fold domain-containing protein [Burkholderiales bacterium]MDE2160762.1 alpha/beta hydrolase fold domain-containing protein [Burkholderiales bacterium]MDE2502569.1 alpha/beta hydrolase fold domain-containing protein [Burkholderiales bacterium]
MKAASLASLPVLFAIVALLALAIVAGRSWLQSRAKSGPECRGIAAPPERVDGARSAVYRVASGRALRIHGFVPQDPARPDRMTLLFFFGGGFVVGDILQFADQARALQARGHVALLADYRVRCRDGTGARQAIADGHAAYAWLRAHAPDWGVDARRIVLAGGSAGGRIAFEIARRAPDGAAPAALLLFNPDLGRLDEPVRLPPTLVFHGDADTDVPIAASRRLCERAHAAGGDCRLQAYPGAGHGFFNRREVDPATGASPFDDTLARALAFVDAVGARPLPG